MWGVGCPRKNKGLCKVIGQILALMECMLCGETFRQESKTEKRQSEVFPTWHHCLFIYFSWWGGGRYDWSKPRNEAQKRAQVLENHFGR